MFPTTFSKGHSDSEEKLENIIKCVVKIQLYLDHSNFVWFFQPILNAKTVKDIENFLIFFSK